MGGAPVTLFHVNSRKFGHEVFVSLYRALDTFYERRCGFTIDIIHGRQENTKWGETIRLFGDTVVKASLRGRAERFHSSLKECKGTLGEMQNIFMFPEKKEVKTLPEELETDVQADMIYKADADHFPYYWHKRSQLEKAHPGLRRIIWEECERRYGDCRTPIEIDLIEDKGVNMKQVKGKILERLKQREWPVFLIEWHQKNLRVNLKAPATIGEIVNNVQKHSCGKECMCQGVKQRLKEAGFTGELPTIDGRIFLLGREYLGPCKDVFTTPSMNIPAQSERDRTRSFKGAFSKLPQGLFSLEEWEQVQKNCAYHKPKWDRNFVTCSQVFKVKKLLQGLVIGPVDKNSGESSIVCPSLYHKALGKMYSKEAGYM